MKKKLLTATLAALMAGCADEAQPPPQQSRTPADPDQAMAAPVVTPPAPLPAIAERLDLSEAFEDGKARIKPDQVARIEDVAFDHHHSPFALAVVWDGESDLGKARAWTVGRELQEAGIDPGRVFLAQGAPGHEGLALIAFREPEALAGMTRGELTAMAGMVPVVWEASAQEVATAPDLTPIGRRERFTHAFGSGGAEPRHAWQRKAIEAFADAVMTSPYRVLVLAHADGQGDPQANLALGLKRAGSVAEALQAAGLDGSRIFIASAGESDPLESNASREGRAVNRRFELIAFTDRKALEVLEGMPAQVRMQAFAAAQDATLALADPEGK